MFIIVINRTQVINCSRPLIRKLRKIDIILYSRDYNLREYMDK